MEGPRGGGQTLHVYVSREWGGSAGMNVGALPINTWQTVTIPLFRGADSKTNLKGSVHITQTLGQMDSTRGTTPTHRERRAFNRSIEASMLRTSRFVRGFTLGLVALPLFGDDNFDKTTTFLVQGKEGNWRTI